MEEKQILQKEKGFGRIERENTAEKEKTGEYFLGKAGKYLIMEKEMGM